MTPEKTAVNAVAALMALAARTAPKAKGVDTICIRVISRPELRKLSATMTAYGKAHDIGFFLRDAHNIAASDACVVIGCRGTTSAGVNCGACGYPSCAAMEKAAKRPKRQETAFPGPNCAMRMSDLGIALGSAAKTAQIHNADNRIMYSAGVAAIELGLVGEGCTCAYGIPLSASGKNIYFDRESVK